MGIEILYTLLRNTHFYCSFQKCCQRYCKSSSNQEFRHEEDVLGRFIWHTISMIKKISSQRLFAQYRRQTLDLLPRTMNATADRAPHTTCPLRVKGAHFTSHYPCLPLADTEVRHRGAGTGLPSRRNQVALSYRPVRIIIEFIAPCCT